MKKSKELQTLTESINRLQLQRSHEWILLRDQFHLTYESLKPINLIKHTFKEASSSTEVRKGVFNNVIALTTGYFTKAILLGSSVSPLKKIMGTLLQFTVATLITHNSGSIKSIGKAVFNKLFRRPIESDLKLSNNGNANKNLTK
ncbi:MAG TPA: hypothetical protein VGQ59_18700 [Cyclobacteriaceae bacterium]|nr:hypothetical protein [Cyclobacteriaceae bacterium]